MLQVQAIPLCLFERSDEHRLRICRGLKGLQMKLLHLSTGTIRLGFTLLSSIAIVLASSLLGCSESSGPSRESRVEITGKWTLAGISSQELPFTIAGGGFGPPTLITKASLDFATGTGVDSVVYAVGDQIQADTIRFSFSQRGDTVFFTRPPFVDTGLVVASSPAQLKVRRNFKVGASGFPSGRVDALYVKPSTVAAERAMLVSVHETP